MNFRREGEVASPLVESGVVVGGVGVGVGKEGNALMKDVDGGGGGGFTGIFGNEAAAASAGSKPTTTTTASATMTAKWREKKDSYNTTINLIWINSSAVK